MLKVMRVAYPMRVDAFDKPGGDVQLIRTYISYCTEVARKHGVAYEGEILASLDPDLRSFDVVHLTNTDRPFDLYAQFLAGRKAGKPTVITPRLSGMSERGAEVPSDLYPA